jgi:hypothetical protein
MCQKDSGTAIAYLRIDDPSPVRSRNIRAEAPRAMKAIPHLMRRLSWLSVVSSSSQP